MFVQWTDLHNSLQVKQQSLVHWKQHAFESSVMRMINICTNRHFPHINTGNKVLLLMWQTGRSWCEGASVLDESDPGPEEMSLQPKQETGNRKQAPCQEVYHPDNNRAQCGVWWQRWASEKSRLEYAITSVSKLSD